MDITLMGEDNHYSSNIYIAEALSVGCLVNTVGLTVGISDTFVLVGAASLSTFTPSGPAFLGTLQVAYALAIELPAEPARRNTRAALTAAPARANRSRHSGS